MISMIEIEYGNLDWIDIGFLQPGASGALLPSLLSKRAVNLYRLERARVELSQLIPAMPEPFESTRLEIWAYYCNLVGDGPSLQLDSFLPTATVVTSEWRSSWQLLQFRVECLREKVRFLRQRSRLLNYGIALLLVILACPRFLCQFIRRERAWSLLHGSHPPRQNAGLAKPGFAQLGRVCRIQGC
jgi:hypothetical protein